MKDSILEFFRQNTEFDRLLSGMSDMYIRYGRSYGAVRLAHPSVEEEAAISTFFDRDYYNQSVMRISLAEFERQLQKKWSPTATLADLLESYFPNNIAPEAIKPQKNTDALANQINEALIPAYKNTRAESWLAEVLANIRQGYKIWARKYLVSPVETIEMFRIVSHAINNLPEANAKRMRLSEFSLAFANSHDAFSFHGIYGSLFLRALSHCYNENIAHTLEESISLYLRAGLMSNGLSSQVMVLGLNAKSGDGIPDPACSYYSKINEPHILTLENIIRFEQIEAYNQKVFIIENPSICAALIDRIGNKSHTLVCPINGHNAAFMRLLEIIPSSTIMYYAGNINYNSLALADKLYLKFTKNFKPWRYSKSDYEKILEKNSTMLQDKKKDLSLHNETLASLLSQLRKKGRTASSMPLVPLFAEDILEEGEALI